jgi:signal transduction histidine kinase
MMFGFGQDGAARQLGRASADLGNKASEGLGVLGNAVDRAAVFGLWPKRTALIALTVALVGLMAIIGVLDYLSGAEISLSVIYAFPIAIAAWYINRVAAYALSLLGVLLWIAVNFLNGIVVSTWLVPVWNASIRLAFYVLLIELLTQIRYLTRDLELRVSQRTRELRKEIAERERLQREMIETAERERQRVGRDLHDGLCQHLTGTALTVQRLAAKLEKRKLPEAGDAARAVDLIEEGIALARDMSKGLQPLDMHSGGLMLALDEFAASTSEIFGIVCRFECSSPVGVADTWTANNLYNIVREATANAIKHGGARTVTISLEASNDGTLLKVQDDGCGVSVRPLRNGGMGLRIMRQRAQLIGATFVIQRCAPVGTVVSCFLQSL